MNKLWVTAAYFFLIGIACIALKRYNTKVKYNNSSGQGETPYRRYSPRPALAADLVQFQNRQ